MRKRSIANRHFGVSNDAGIEPFDGKASPVIPTSSTPAQDSPTVAASPTMSSGSFASATPNVVVEHTTHPFLAASIALSVLLGIVLLGLVSWIAFAYRRRRKRGASNPVDKDIGERNEHDMFSSSNIVEKGMRRSSISSSKTDGPKSIISSCAYSDGRRVSFVGTPMHSESFADVHRPGPFTPPADVLVGAKRTRQRSSTLSAIERTLMSSRPPSTMTISTLDPIEEETVIVEFTSPADRPETPVAEAERPDSIASTTTRFSAYTTASARSSISDLTTLSTISCLSAFPETPRAESRESALPPDTPSKTVSPDARKNRARSQTVVNVKSVDLLRTAVGRTMSLQPSKDVACALQQLSAAEETQMLAELCRGREALLFRPPSPELVQSSSVECLDADEGDTTLVENVLESPRPSNGMSKTLFSPESKPLAMGMDDETPTSSPVTRSRSFPSKLLSRRQGLPISEETRRSEVLTGGYLKRALRAIRGEDEMPQMPASFADAIPGRINWRDSTDSTSTLAAESSSHTLDDVPFSPTWDDQDHISEYDAYYLYQQNGFELGEVSDEEEGIEGHRSGDLPHIRITSH